MERLNNKFFWPKLMEVKEVTDEDHDVEDIRIKSKYGNPGEVASKFAIVNNNPETHYFIRKREGLHVSRTDIIAILKILR
mgnify:FL=1